MAKDFLELAGLLYGLAGLLKGLAGLLLWDSTRAYVPREIP